MVTLHMIFGKEPLAGPKSSTFLKAVVSRLRPKRNPDALTNAPADLSNSDRCDFTFSDGRQCRTPRAQLCVHHQRSCGEKSANRRGHSASNESVTTELPELEGLCADLTTATSINRALSHVFLMLAQGRISQKQAVAFGYLSQLLLQTVHGIRSEFVSVHGYEPWEEKLAGSLGGDEDKDPGPSRSQYNGTQGEKSKISGNPGVKCAADKSACESRSSYRIKKIKPHAKRKHPRKRPLSERIADPDYGSLLSRSLDMFAGKYSTTPEGRREEKSLLTELELIGPPAPKSSKGIRASAMDYMRWWINEGTEPDAAPSVPPALNWYGDPIKPAAPAWSSLSVKGQQEDAPLPVESDRCAQSFTRTSSRESSRSPSVPVNTFQSDQGNSPGSFIQPEAFFAPAESGPVPPNAPPNREGHTTDWYAPPSWTGNRPRDPFPNRQERLKQKLRGMSSSKVRRLQHFNSRCF
jgi:hypothetical protein